MTNDEVFVPAHCIRYNDSAADRACFAALADFIADGDDIGITWGLCGEQRFIDALFRARPQLRDEVIVLDGALGGKLPSRVFLCEVRANRIFELTGRIRARAPETEICTVGVLENVAPHCIPVTAYQQKIASIYPLAIPEIALADDLDFLLLDLPANYCILRVGVGYVHECAKRMGVRHQTLDLNMILYHRFHSHRILDRPGPLVTASGYTMPDDPWGALVVDEWCTPDIVDHFRPDIQEFIEQVALKRPRIIAISLQMGNRLLAKDVVRQIRERAPGTVIVVGGFDCVHREFGPRIFKDFDYMVIGESEQVLPGLIRSLLGGEKPRDLAGIVSRFDSPDRTWTPAPLPQDLDALPFPTYDWADISLFRYFFGLMIAPLAINRGCKWSRCTFCNECFTWRKRSPEHVVDEMQWFVDRGCRSFDFSVSDAIGDSATLLGIAREITRRGLQIVINTQLRIDRRSDVEFFRALYAAGFQHLAFGVDGWSDRMLRLQNKGYNFALVKQNLRDAHEAGIRVSVNIVLGIPEETTQDVVDSVNNILSVKEYLHGFNSIYPLMLSPGSKYYEDPDKYNISFRGDQAEIYENNPYKIPPELWYSNDPYIDQSVRVSRILFLHKHLTANNVPIASHVIYMLNKIIGEYNKYNESMQALDEPAAEGPAEAAGTDAELTRLTELAHPELLLSILCHGRNDSGEGNFAWRLATVLNKHAENVLFLGLEQQVEILVSDWGNEIPLYRTLELTENARRLVRFLVIDPELARQCHRDAGYSMPHALNALARRARGKYLLCSDSDLFVPMETLAKTVHFLKLGYFHSFNLADSFFWGSRYSVPEHYVAESPYREHLEEKIRQNRGAYRHVKVGTDAYAGSGGSLLMSREMWVEATGWDERLAGSHCADIDLTRRLLSKYRWDDLENHGVELFHFEQRGGAPRATEKAPEPAAIGANPDNWGLAGHDLSFVDGFGLAVAPSPAGSPVAPGLYFDRQGPLRTVRDIVASGPRYRDIGGRFPFEPHSFFCNGEAVSVMLQTLQPRSVCEIGTWMGASARSFAAHASVRQVVCVDHWDRYRIEKYQPGVHPEHMMNNMYEQFLANAVHSGTDGKTCPIRLDSDAAVAYCAGAGMKFDLIYVDGDHTTVGARSDILRWYPLLSEGGYMCGDDWTWQKEPDNVSGAVVSVARDKDLRVYFHGNFWLLMPGGFSIQPLTMDVFSQIKPIREALPGTPAPAAEQPLVSIFCTCKNAEVSIRRHIEAVIAAIRQYDNIEYVVQDGVSTDATLSIFEEYRPLLGDKLKLVSAKDSCCEEGFWLALSRCQGDIVYPSLSDEEVLPDAIPFVVRQFRDHPEIDVVHGDIYNTDLQGNIELRNPSREFDLVAYLSHQLPMHLAASFFRRSAFERAGLLPYPNRYGLLKDDFFTWAYLGQSANISYFPEVFAKYSVHDNALSVRPSLLIEGIARRWSFIRNMCTDSSSPLEVRANMNIILAKFYSVSIYRLTKAELTDEAEKYRAALAELVNS